MPIFLFQPYYLMYMNNAYKRVTGSGNPNQPQLATGKSNSTCELSYNRAADASSPSQGFQKAAGHLAPPITRLG